MRKAAGKTRASGTGLSDVLERVSHLGTRAAGSSWAFVLATLVVVVWLVTGPLFDYSRHAGSW